MDGWMDGWMVERKQHNIKFVVVSKIVHKLIYYAMNV
jgi:hypothetical protein